jgi:hypothetical protein
VTLAGDQNDISGPSGADDVLDGQPTILFDLRTSG